MLYNRNRSNQRLLTKNSMATLLGIVIALTALQYVPSTSAAVHPVFTYKNGSTLLGQLLTSSTLNWESYDASDPKQLQYAVEGGKYITEDEHYPIYVCRVTIDGAPTSGHTEKIAQAHVCVAAHYKNGKYHNFDVLVNKGHLGKIAWKPWRKFNVGVPIGAIRIGDDAYIARHRVPHQPSEQQQDTETQSVHGEQRGADFNLGRLDNVGLGKIKVVENEREKDYDEGEVLVETEPFRYELRHIKLDQLRLDIRDNITELASATLENRGNKYSTVETAMSYDFDYIQYWGAHEGVARGLPTKVYEKDSSVPAEINWALKYAEKRYETKSVHTQLHPGTALNVTLKGNYVTLNAPYKAKLFAFYYGSEESVSRTISAEVRKSYLKDVKLEFSPVYWIENGTTVPTTTTTSTTSTTTHATTTTGEPTPMHEPPVVHIKNVGQTHSGPDSLEKSLNDATVNNEIPNDEGPGNYAEKQEAKSAKACVAGVCNGAAAAAQQFSCCWTGVLTLLLLTAFTVKALKI